MSALSIAVQGFLGTTGTTTTTEIRGGGGGGGKKRRIRIRRSDFSSQGTYELALKTAMEDAGIAVVEPEPEVVNDTEIKVSPKQLIELQEAPDLDEIKLIAAFIKAIESEYE